MRISSLVDSQDVFVKPMACIAHYSRVVLLPWTKTLDFSASFLADRTTACAKLH